MGRLGCWECNSKHWVLKLFWFVSAVKEEERSAETRHSNCLHNLWVAGSISVWLTAESRVGIKSDTAGGDCFIILIWPSPPGCSQPRGICGGRTHTDAHAAKQFTSVSMSTGLMPKKGLMAIPGTISASGSDGFGAMQMPPVSEVKTKQIIK